jgi:hypothetical protein
MRFIFWLAAGMSAAAIATAAPARPGGGGSGHGPGFRAGWSNGGGHHNFKGRQTRFGIGRIEIDRRHWRHRGRSGRSGPDGFTPYGGLGIAGPVGDIDPYGNGFFTGGGGQIRLRGGQPYFDYDRAYPYEFASANRAREPERTEAAHRTEAPPRCNFENGVRVCRGW